MVQQILYTDFYTCPACKRKARLKWEREKPQREKRNATRRAYISVAAVVVAVVSGLAIYVQQTERKSIVGGGLLPCNRCLRRHRGLHVGDRVVGETMAKLVHTPTGTN